MNIDALNVGYEGQLGAGRVDALNALTQPLAAPTITDFKINGVSVADGGTVNGISTITLSVPQRLNPASVNASSFELRSDGPDNVFGNLDDLVLPVTLAVPYRIGAETITLNLASPLTADRYRFMASSGPSQVRDPFDTPLNGTLGSPFIRTFDVAASILNAREVHGDTLSRYAEPVRPAIYPDGSFVLTWSAYQIDLNDYEVYARLFDVNGIAKSAEFQVNQASAGAQYRPAIARLSNDRFVISWESPQEGSRGIVARLFEANGTPVGNEFTVNQYTTSEQVGPQVFALGSGFVIAYTSDLQDGSDYGVYACLLYTSPSPRD